MRYLVLICLTFLCLPAGVVQSDNLSYLDSPCDPYYPNRKLAKLTTPQWCGERDVDAVVILSIDDMRDSAKYEAFLRPVLDRLKQIDGRAPISIFANSVDAADPQLQKWLQEGLSLETHTADHPCPLLCDGDFAKAKSTYERCVDQLSLVANNEPVAFRMPCCDSLNTPSPRFWTEIFDKKTSKGNFLSIDSSVFNIFTRDDPDLPNDLVVQADGKSRFRSYLPFPSFVNTIENYPYPYVINGTCWEFPCVVPSDWEAQHVQQPNNPKTVEGWKRALDATVIKQGVMPIVFHPHGWIRAEQIVQFIDYAEKAYGKRVRFLTFSESLSRINEHLLGGVSLREADGNKWKVHLVDVNQDGYMDVVRNGTWGVQTRVWNPEKQRTDLHDGNVAEGSKVYLRSPKFGRVGNSIVYMDQDSHVQPYQWKPDPAGSPLSTFGPWKGVDFRIAPDPKLQLTSSRQLKHFQFKDIDNDGTSELFFSTADKTIVLEWKNDKFSQLPIEVPVYLDAMTSERAIRFVDLDHDDLLDILISSDTEKNAWLFKDKQTGWLPATDEQPQLAKNLPAIAGADGSNNGAWFHSDHMWVQNEHTAHLPDHVDRVAFKSIIAPPAENDAPDLGKARSLEESVSTFSVIAPYRIEVAAAEPQIADPVAFDWGPAGELWVVEMGDYPNGSEWHGPGDRKGISGGRVKLLYDKNDDGRFETSHLFLDGLSVPTGVKAYRKGVLVCVPPKIIYAQDTNGDFIADQTEVLYEGMNEGNEQHRSNGLRWGLDHWLHLANGDSGGVVRSHKTGKSIDIRGRDFKIHPDTGGFELTAGQSQFGRSRDNLGNWFGGSNSEPVWHYVLEDDKQARNPFTSSPSSRHVTSRTPGAAPVFPTSQTFERFNDFDRANRFTSACSTEISRDDADQRKFVYVCEPVHNLVHRSLLTKDGVSFSSTRAEDEQGTEFLTSSDNWFRPVMVRSGPNGAIWIADMYRQVIEHPEWIPMEWQKQIDHLSGNDKGRIYRLVLDEDGAETTWKQIATASTQQLVEQLETPNGILRDMIQQQLYERNSDDTTDLLRNAFGKTRWKSARLPILHLLRHFRAIDEKFLVDAFQQDRISPQMLDIIQPQIYSSQNLKDHLFGWLERTQIAIEDQIPIAYLLGELDDPRAPKLLADFAIESEVTNQRYLRAAVMSSISKNNIAAVAQNILTGFRSKNQPISGTQILSELISVAVGMENRTALNSIVQTISRSSTPTEQLAILSEIRDAMTRHGKTLNQLYGPAELQVLNTVAARAASTALDSSLSPTDRLTAMSVFGLLPSQEQAERLALHSLLDPQHPPQLQADAIKRLRQTNAAPHEVFAGWKTYSPRIRSQIIQETLRNESWTSILLRKMEQSDISQREIDIHERNLLRKHKNESVRTRAAQLFQQAPSDRVAVVQKHLNAIAAATDPSKGKQAFAKHCSTCHQLEGQGTAIGPNLVALTDKSRPALLTAILDPNQALEDKYVDYVLVQHNGEVLQGQLAEESATSVTLAMATGKYTTILRKNIELMKSTGKSLMPEGLEEVLKTQELENIVSYVQSVKSTRKTFAGNEPRTAPIRDDGSIRLFGMHAEIYGPHVVFEPRYRNLGFWQSEQDRATWTVLARKAGRYRVTLDYSCAPEHANNRIQLHVNGQKISSDVQSTGSWDNYRSLSLGSIELPAEQTKITLTSEGPIEGFLLDLRTVILYPE